MIIKKISIARFRGFHDLNIELGELITVIAGANGTQKTTILGMLSQPFSLDKTNSMYKEKPLCGGNFRSALKEKFKFSDRFDKPKEHEWTLYLNQEEPYTVESMLRDQKSQTIRFWKKGDRTKGSGYIQKPVIFLSLKRLLPIGEDEKLKEDNSVILSNEEIAFFAEWHNDILISVQELTSPKYISSTQKNTIGAETSVYDWRQNSAGQDNLGKILLAVLSFKRLKEKYPDDYDGGILAIDEVDSTLYPGSQLRLLTALRRFASKYKIQIVFTTHSLTMLQKACELSEKRQINGQIRIAYLEKFDNQILNTENPSFNYIQQRLNVTNESAINKKIDVFTEDKETACFAKVLLKTGYTKHLRFINQKLGCDNLVSLATQKVSSFTSPNSIIILDGDVRKSRKKMRRIKALSNVLILPLDQSPEVLIAKFLMKQSELNPIWESFGIHFTKIFCFKEIKIKEIKDCRIKSKKWFNSHLKAWGRNAVRVIKPWAENNKDEVEQFKADFVKIYNKIAKTLSIQPVE